MCGGKKAIKKNICYATNLNFTVPKMDAEELREKTLENQYNLVKQGKAKSFLKDTLPDETLFRWEVNYLRHSCTNYNALLAHMKNKPGETEMNLAMKTTLLKRIAALYPHLSNECYRQLEFKKNNPYDYLLSKPYQKKEKTHAQM